ncbi:MAG: SRPBCC family protein [Telluria sp.]
MVSIVSPASALPSLLPVTQPLPNGSTGNLGVLPAAAAAIAAEAELVLPASQPLATPPAATAGNADDQAALRPDQVFMARQMGFPALDGRALASNWRSMVRTYGDQRTWRDLQARTGAIAPMQLAAGQQGQAVAQAQTNQLLPPADAWRFTVHAGSAREHYLEVVVEREDEPPGRRRNARFGLRLELSLADGTRIVVQVEPTPGGLALELCAPNAEALARLRALQPALEQAVEQSGLQVLRWRFRDSLPPGKVHASMAASEASNALTLPVFRALAEMALLLPLGPTAEPEAS